MDISTGTLAGTWQPILLNGEPNATLICPKGHFGYLDHDISDEGVVSPLVHCSGDADGVCDFHESITLLGWEANKWSVQKSDT